MKKLLFLFGFTLLALWVGAQQRSANDTLLFEESFETADSFMVADTGSFGPQKGNNQWIINNDYTGNAIYPNTTREDSVYFNNGTIYLHPFSHYLHIYDSGYSPTDTDANFDPASASDRFVYTKYGFCTLGYTNVNIRFFYILQGDTDSLSIPPKAYGQLYYSINDSAWVALPGQYRNQTDWRFVQINDTAFNNKPNVRFGFRWVNDSSSIPRTISFGIDDIQVIGTFDSTNNPIQITVTPFYSTVCANGIQYATIHLSSPLCDGQYELLLSDANGNFANATDMGYVTIPYPDTSFFFYFIIPSSTPAGNCYKIMIIRDGIQRIVGTASICFAVQRCPNYIWVASTPLVLTDVDTACVHSVIEIKFYSSGVYGANNVYTALLSDSAGNFADSTVIGSSPDPNAYDPNVGSMPGVVGGTIPVVPAGCNYYIKIVSSSPSVRTDTNLAGTAVYGPYCIKHCDILTNHMQDIHVCITDSIGDDTTKIALNIHTFNNAQHYYSGNKFAVELLSTMTFGVVNIGGIGVVYDSISDSFFLTIPNSVILGSLGIQPGVYYARIVSDSSNEPFDTTGSLIHLTIGAPSSHPAVGYFSDTLICGFVPNETLTILPPAPTSSYWLYTYSNAHGHWLAFPFKLPVGQNIFPFSVPAYVAADIYSVRIVEVNYGCPGPFSGLAHFQKLPVPSGGITAPLKICTGDTVKLTVPFVPLTGYDWTPSWGKIIDTANNQISMVFDSIGNISISNYAFNQCGTHLAFDTLKVVSLVTGGISPDSTSICKGDQVQLTANATGLQKALVTTFTTAANTEGIMFNVVARNALTIDSLDGNFTAGGPVPLAIYYKTGSFAGHQRDSTAWTFLDSLTVTNLAPVDSPTAIPYNIGMAMNPGDTLAFYITTTNRVTRLRFQNGTLTPAIPIASDSILNIYEGPTVSYKFGSGLSNKIWSGYVNYTTQAGLRFRWNTGDSIQQILLRPDSTANYTVKVSDTSGCSGTFKTKVQVNPNPVAHIGNDATTCKGNSVTVNASISHSTIFHWSPTTGIPDTNALSFSVKPDSNITYYLLVKDSLYSCAGKDSIKIAVRLPSTTNDTSSFCVNKPATVLRLPDIAPGHTYSWSTGDSTQAITVTIPGSYSGTYVPLNDSCVSNVSFYVTTRTIATSSDTSSFCKDNPVAILKLPDGQIGGTYNWSTGDTTQSITVSTPGSYTGSYIPVGDSCITNITFQVSSHECTSSLQAAQAFTPNGDGVNDHFTVFGQYIVSYEISIYNRWGELVYHSTDPSELNDLARGWDGTHNGKEQNVGTFVYYIKAKDAFNKNIEEHGNVTLIR